MKRFFLIILVLCLPASPLLARVINVPGEYATIQAGIDASISGDTVLVGPGTYTESLIIENKNISLLSVGALGSTGILGRIKFQGSSIDTTCILRGFTIYGNSYSILIEINDVSPKIEGNRVNGGWGGETWGIKMLNSRAIIRSNIISGGSNSISYGIYADNGFALIEENIIFRNTASAGGWSTTGWGARIKSGIIKYNLIFDNGASTYYGSAYGGGITAVGESLTIRNNTIANNWANSPYTAWGYGLLFTVPSQSNDIIIRNNIIANNFPFGVSATITDSTWTGWDYNLVFGDSNATYRGLQPGPHDIQLDPLFSSNYHLLPNSPCIDAGDPSSPLDPDSTRADIGAYFFDHSVDVEENGAPTGPYDFTLRQNYPNPFNAQTIISYCLDKEATVSLHIYAITGHLVKPLLN
jgi:hypothetical protein